MLYDSPRQIAAFLAERGLSLKKRFGQNFLISPGVRKKILSLLELTGAELVWEIGGGIGSLTHELCEAVGRLVVFEIDHGFVRVLEEGFAGRRGIEIVAGDFLETWRSAVERFGPPRAIVGNLPYRSAAPIMATLAEWELPVDRALFTVQREVALRMAATPGSRDYSSFSLLCQSVFAVRLHGEVAPASFYPVPEVVSSIVGLVAKGLPRDYDLGLYADIVRDLFASRRKTVRNNLLSGRVGRRFTASQIDSALGSASIDPGNRGERLSVSEVVGLVRSLSAAAVK